MRWVNGLVNQKDDYRRGWHRWFAIYPVIIGNTARGGVHRHIKCWLEFVERKGTYHPPLGYGDFGSRWTWEYRDIK